MASAVTLEYFGDVTVSSILLHHGVNSVLMTWTEGQTKNNMQTPSNTISNTQ